MKSVWQDTLKEPISSHKNTWHEDINTDVLVIGGGMCGILCAYKLKKIGIKCVLVEASTIASGITKNTTAKITAQHGIIYSKIIDTYGKKAARKYYVANMRAINDYRKLSESISCDFEEKTAYVYSVNNKRKLEREMSAYIKLGINKYFDKNPPLPFKTVGALGMLGQAQFNPLKLIRGLVKDLDIYENTFVTDIKNNEAITTHGKIRAKKIIIATHFPMVNIPGLYFLKMYQHRSYIIALQGVNNIEDMYVDEREKGLSFRSYNDYLLVGGGDHRTGKKGGGWDELRKFSEEFYPNGKEKYSWSTQDCMTLDSIPYIGLHNTSNSYLYVATGFNKWGMTGSMVASKVLTDLIVQGQSEFSSLFSPQRSMFHLQLPINMLNATEGLISFGKRCPHMGCGLKWNPLERTWDCPCHGSRFTKEGNVIDNPAKRGM